MSDASSSVDSASSASCARESSDRTDSLPLASLAPVDVADGATSMAEELTSVRPGASFRAKSGETSIVTDSVRCVGDADEDSNEAA